MRFRASSHTASHGIPSTRSWPNPWDAQNDGPVDGTVRHSVKLFLMSIAASVLPQGG